MKGNTTLRTLTRHLLATLATFSLLWYAFASVVYSVESHLLEQSLVLRNSAWAALATSRVGTDRSGDIRIDYAPCELQ